MQTAPDLSDLIARLEKATGPCRKLDLDISVAVNYSEAFTGAARAEWSIMADDINVYDATGRRYILDPAQFVPQWTRSLDAAVSLVPEGCGVLLAIGRGSRADVSIGYLGEMNATWPGGSNHPVPAIALCIAALKARPTPKGGTGQLSGNSGWFDQRAPCVGHHSALAMPSSSSRSPRASLTRLRS